MNDDRVSQALKSLPREQAGLGFTARVLRRIEESPPRAVLRQVRWSLVTAGAIAILALGLGWREWQHRQAAERLQVMLAEKQELEEELEALRQLAANARPVVYLGSEDQIDLVLDLGRFRRQGGFGSNLPAHNSAPSEAPGRDIVPAARTRKHSSSQEAQTVRPLRVVY